MSNNANYQWHGFDSQSALASQLAGVITQKIAEAIAQKGHAVVAFSGGSTPKPLFQALQQQDIDWARVIVTLVDERWVPETHELSNGAFLKRYLLDELSVQPVFVPLYQEADTVDASLSLVADDMTQKTQANRPAFDVVILGMGGDGHTASFFPDAENVAELVNANSDDVLLTCHSPSTQVERVTWSLPALLNTSLLALHIVGESKEVVFQQALQSDDAIELPIRSAIFQSKTPLEVFYAS